MPWQSIISPDPPLYIRSMHVLARTVRPRARSRTRMRVAGVRCAHENRTCTTAPLTFGTLVRVESGQGKEAHRQPPTTNGAFAAFLTSARLESSKV